MAVKSEKNQNTQVFRREGRNWLILLLLVLAALVVATGITLGSRWVYREYIEDEPEPVSPLEIQSEGQTAPADATEQKTQTEGAGSSESNQNEPSEPLPATGG